ncbi:hypothetical protein EDB84DRAFT_1558096 [Lactarius hengduanensis]|nr:hypothetical protein EDB84DRAFT_1558096 [Lactarius hengduanensis]
MSSNAGVQVPRKLRGESFLAGEPVDIPKSADEDQASSTVLPGVSNPMNDLPVEILQHIFTCCAEPRSPDSNPFPEVYPEWIAITYVSRHWRAVALNHRSLWGLITPNLLPDWLRALIVRSEPAPVDANLRVGQETVKRICLCIDEVIGALAGCTRLRSLRLVGPRRDVSAVLDVLLRLPEGLFGGEAPLRYIHFTANRCIVAPSQLLRGVTHFTSGEQIPLLLLLNALHQMPMLTHFTLQYCRAQWQETDAPCDLVIEMPHLTNLVVHADSPRFFVLLNEHLSLPKGAKRWLELHALAIAGWSRWARWFATLPPIIEAANGLKHAYLSGGAKEGTFRVWTGDMDSVCEDAEFCFDMYWYGSPTNPPDPYPTGASRVRNLELEGHSELPHSLWWELLQKLQAVEQLEIHSSAANALYSAWDDVDAPTVLPALQRVRFVRTEKATTATSIATKTTVEPQLHGTAVRGSFISRIMPSRSPRPEPPAHTAPITYRTAKGPSSDSEPLAIHAETALGLIKLLHGGVAHISVLHRSTHRRLSSLSPVAHHHPPLWSLITPNLNVFWADIFQQHSQPLLLDVHLRVGRRDIDDREASMSTYPAMVILRFISHRVRTLRLDGPREDIQSLLSTLRTPSPIHALSINIPLWDLGAPFSIPESLFSLQRVYMYPVLLRGSRPSGPQMAASRIDELHHQRQSVTSRSIGRAAPNAHPRTLHATPLQPRLERE